MSLFAEGRDIPVVSARELALAYGGRRVLRDATFRIMAGEWWFAVGPNGAGKTTLVRALLGQLAPSEGGIALGPGLDDRTRLGYVAQRVELPPTVPTTVREFVGLGFAGLKLDAAERGRRLAAALERVGLADRMMDPFGDLSGGQRQRAAIARALVRDPLLLVLDEPTTGLDLVAERDLLALIADLNKTGGLTVFYVGHDLAVAAAHATHVAVVAGGTVRGGPAAELLTAPVLSAAFGVEVEAPHA